MLHLRSASSSWQHHLSPRSSLSRRTWNRISSKKPASSSSSSTTTTPPPTTIHSLVVSQGGRQQYQFSSTTNTTTTRRLPLSSSSSRNTGGGSGSGNGGNGNGGIPTYIWLGALLPTIGGIFLYYKYLDEVPITHRKRWIATSPEWERRLGDQEYQKLLKQYQGQILPKDHRASITVHRVGSRITKAAEIFSKEHHIMEEFFYKANQRPTTFTVIRSDMANAFVLPNNHIFVMTGLFQFVHNEDDLAAVLGHEMAHNLARHVGEKVSSSIVLGILARLSLFLDPSGVLLTIIVPASSLLRELPHSRTQETEADQIGIYLAAQACYDPRAAKRVFQNMKDATTTTSNNKGSSSSPPEFLSTHPSHDTRIENFDQWMETALQTYHQEDGERCRRIRQEMITARQIAALRAAQNEEKRENKIKIGQL